MNRNFRSRKNNGFTLIEVLVAMFVGLIVMGMAVGIVGVTNSVSLRVLAKSDTQQTARNSIVRILDSVANAESLDTCRLGKDAATQTAIQGPPSIKYHSIAPANCKEITSTGFVVAWAGPNKFCYFDKDEGSGPASVQCVSRGGVAASNPIALDGDFNNLTMEIDLTNCLDFQPGIDEDLVYQYSCLTNGAGDKINWPSSYSAPVAGDTSLLADLGTSVVTTSTTSPLAVSPIFEYRIDGLPNATAVSEANLVNIVAVSIDLNIVFDNKRESRSDTFKFNQTIVLRGSKKAQEEQYNG